MSNWEEPLVHIDLVCHDARAVDNMFVHGGHLQSLEDPEVLEIAKNMLNLMKS